MVQILPQKTNLGSQIGQSLGGGLQQGIGQGIQRGMLQQALGKVKDISQQGGNPLEALTSLLEAGAGIPGSEKYIGAIAPLLLAQMRTQNQYGEDARGGGAPMAPAEASSSAQKLAMGDEPSGFFAPPMNPDQMQQYATRYAHNLGDPAAFDKGLQQAAALNSTREQSREAFAEQAQAMGVPPQDMPRYLQMAKEFQNLKDPAQINRAAFQKYQKIDNLKKSLQNIVVPGIGTRLLEEGKPKLREQYLKKSNNLVANLINEGEEPFVRQTLASIGLSPTEVEERIHPLTPEKEKSLASLPPGNKMDPKSRKESLVNYLRKNVDNDTSLSVIRQHLVDEKNYDWREFADAVTEAFPEGARLNQWQNAELTNIASPPKQSLNSLLGPAGDIRNFFRGAK